MSKVATDDMIDGGLDKVATCVTYTVCAGQPVSQADIAVKALASVVIDAADFVKANGDVSGRKVTVASQVDISIGSTGTSDHLAIDDGTGYEITTCTPQALTAGGKVTGPAFDIEISAPS